MGTSGGVKQHLYTASGFIDNSTLGGREKDVLCPSPDVPQTSFLPVSWDSAGIVWPCQVRWGIPPEPWLEAV